MKGVLFLSTDGAFRGAMADVLARRVLRPNLEVFSAALRPARSSPAAIAAMAELGIEAKTALPATIGDVLLDRIALVVTLSRAAAEAAESLPSPFASTGTSPSSPSTIVSTGLDLLRCGPCATQSWIDSSPCRNESRSSQRSASSVGAAFMISQGSRRPQRSTSTRPLAAPLRPRSSGNSTARGWSFWRATVKTIRCGLQGRAGARLDDRSRSPVPNRRHGRTPP